MTPSMNLMSLRMDKERQALSEIQDESDRVVMGVYTPSANARGMSGSGKPMAEMIRMVARDSTCLGFDVLKGSQAVGKDFLTVEEVASMHGGTPGEDRLQLYGMSPVSKALKAVQSVALKVPEAPVREVMEMALEDPSIGSRKAQDILMSLEVPQSIEPEPNRPQLKRM